MDETYVNERIKQICAEKGWSDYRLAKECGIPSSTVHNILHKVSAPSFGSLLKICSGLGITMAQFFRGRRRSDRSDRRAERDPGTLQSSVVS